MTKKQHYMTELERYQLEAYLRTKKPVSWIAREMGFCRQTIYNEKQRGEYLHTVNWWDEKRYSAEKGQDVHKKAQKHKGRPLKAAYDAEYMTFIENKILKDKFSPAAALAAAGKLFSMRICVGTVYNYITRRLFKQITSLDLWERMHRKHKSDPVRRIAHQKLPSIEERPEYINTRQEPGHWEMDLVVGGKGGKAVLLTLTERVTRREIIRKLPNRKAETVKRAIDKLEREIPNFREVFKSITTDNGSEFLRYEKIIESVDGGKRFDLYYCHSFASWEKGTVENHNRIIRRWVKKGAKIESYSKKRIQEMEDWMNNYPRKVLGWMTPNEMCNTIFYPGRSSAA